MGRESEGAQGNEGTERMWCPMCSRPALLIIGTNQALCGTPECRMLIFNPSLPDGGLGDAKVIDVKDLQATVLRHDESTT